LNDLQGCKFVVELVYLTDKEQGGVAAINDLSQLAVVLVATARRRNTHFSPCNGGAEAKVR